MTVNSNLSIGKKNLRDLQAEIIKLENAISERLEKANFFQKILYFFNLSSELNNQKKSLQQKKTEVTGLEVDLKIDEINDLEQNYIQMRLLPIVEREIEIMNKFLKVNNKYASDDTKNKWSRHRNKLKNLHSWRESSNLAFVQSEKIKYKQYFDTVESNPLTDKQKEAVISNEENNLVLAGAGSGKTSVIVAKIGYILKKNYVEPDKILILAFNKKAQLELSERIEEKLNVQVSAKTFHSFGLQIVSEAINGKPSLCKWAEDEAALAPLIRSIIMEKLENDNNFYELFSKYFISYFAPYKSREDFESLGEYYEYIRNFDMRTFNDERVKSFEECEISNQLFMWDIDYEYEADYKYPTRTVKHRQYKPDFYLPKYDIYIEHFGISRDGHTRSDIDEKKYLDDMEWKRELHKNRGTNLIETFSYEKREGVLLDALRDKLLAYDVQIGNIPLAKALEHFNSNGKIDSFSKLVIVFMGHFKSNQYKIEDLYAKVTNDREKAFLDIFYPIYKAYEAKKQECGCIDFNDMIAQAVNFVETGQYRSKYEYILVDEFQDISTGRSNLIRAIRDQIEGSNITVVGDDWQSINRFAGSDISIIQNFQNLFGNTETINLDYTFRFNDSVSSIATKFIMKNPKQIDKTINTLNSSNAPSIYVFWYSKDDEKKKIESILSLIDKNETHSGDKKMTIKFLGRYRMKKPDYFSELQSKYLKNLDISFITVHGSKGLEADYIVLLAMEQGKYGFPSEIEDDPLLEFIMPQGDDFDFAEERRLFYVALTRTKKKIFILADKTRPSNFIKELIKDNPEDIYQVGFDFSEIQYCPECKTGILVKRKGKKHWFYGCSNFPYCEYTESVMICPECKKYEVRKDIDHNIAKCIDKNCSGYYRLCKKCHNYMVLRNGKYGQFLGCKSYPECTYTEKI
jgi:DNA helicase-4